MLHPGLISRARHVITVVATGALSYFGRRYYGRRYYGKRYFG